MNGTRSGVVLKKTAEKLFESFLDQAINGVMIAPVSWGVPHCECRAEVGKLRQIYHRFTTDALKDIYVSGVEQGLLIT